MEDEKIEEEDLTQRAQKREMREGGVKPPLQMQEEPKRAGQAPPLQARFVSGKSED